MDVMQIPLKINQTNQQESNQKGIVGSVSQQSSIFESLFGQLLNPAEKGTQEEDSDPKTDLPQLTEEDWAELDSIIMTLLTGIKELQNPQHLEENTDLIGLQNGKLITFQNIEEYQKLEGLTTSLQQGKSAATIAESNPPEAYSMFTVQEDMLAAIKDLQQWLQKAKGSDQTNPLDFKQMIEDLAQLVSKHPPQGTSKSLLVSDSYQNNIESLLGELNFQSQEKSVPQKQLISLDKHQVAFLAKPLQESLVPTQGMSQTVLAEGRDAGPALNENLLVSNQVMSQQGSINRSQSSFSMPSLPASEFAQRASEWIGQNLMISNGKMGSKEARFLLKPEYLGSIEIKISFEQGQLSTQILTETSLAKEALEGQLQQLRQSLQQQGLLVQKLDIVVQQVPITADPSQPETMFTRDGSSFSQEHQNSQSEQSENKKSNNLNEAEQQESSENEQAAFTYGANARTSSIQAASQIDFTA